MAAACCPAPPPPGAKPPSLQGSLRREGPGWRLPPRPRLGERWGSLTLQEAGVASMFPFHPTSFEETFKGLISPKSLANSGTGHF